MGKNEYNFLLSRAQIAALLAVLILAAIALAIVLPGRMWFQDAPALNHGKIAAANERVDPNTATAASLQRLPTIGPSRAQAIVRYRQEQARRGNRAFHCTADLQKVPGIGKGTVRKLAPYLSIESQQPKTSAKSSSPTQASDSNHFPVE